MQDRQHRIDIVSIHAYNITSYAEQPPTTPPMDELGMFRFQCSLGDVDYTTGSHHDVAKTLHCADSELPLSMSYPSLLTLGTSSDFLHFVTPGYAEVVKTLYMLPTCLSFQNGRFLVLEAR